MTHNNKFLSQYTILLYIIEHKMQLLLMKYVQISEVSYTSERQLHTLLYCSTLDWMPCSVVGG